MNTGRDHFLVETSWLEDHLHDPALRIVDMRGYVRTVVHEIARKRSTLVRAEEYAQEHIPGAVYVDWSRDIVDPE